jgi:hypothetical protein
VDGTGADAVGNFNRIHRRGESPIVTTLSTAGLYPARPPPGAGYQVDVSKEGTVKINGKVVPEGPADIGGSSGSAGSEGPADIRGSAGSEGLAGPGDPADLCEVRIQGHGGALRPWTLRGSASLHRAMRDIMGLRAVSGGPDTGTRYEFEYTPALAAEKAPLRSGTASETKDPETSRTPAAEPAQASLAPTLGVKSDIVAPAKIATATATATATEPQAPALVLAQEEGPPRPAITSQSWTAQRWTAIEAAVRCESRSAIVHDPIYEGSDPFYNPRPRKCCVLCQECARQNREGLRQPEMRRCGCCTHCEECARQPPNPLVIPFGQLPCRGRRKGMDTE